MNHLWIMVLHKKVNLLTSHHFIRCRLLITFHLNAFAYLAWIAWMKTTRTSLRSTLAYTSKGMDPKPHVIMPRNWGMWLKASLTNVGLGISSVYCKSLWILSHFRSVRLLAWAMAFCSLWWKQTKGVVQDLHIHGCVILNLWALLPSRWASELTQLHNHLWHTHKCRTKLYLVV
jgi:hypothetical protein